MFTWSLCIICLHLPWKCVIINEFKRVPVAKLDIASDSDSEDRGFESRRARQSPKDIRLWGFLILHIRSIRNKGDIVERKSVHDKIESICA